MASLFICYDPFVPLATRSPRAPGLQISRITLPRPGRQSRTPRPGRHLTSADLHQRAQAQFQDDTKETKYFSLLPPDAKPPLDLNKEMMEKYRPEMRKFYLNRPVQFR